MDKWALEEKGLSVELVLLTEYPSYLTCLSFVWQGIASQGLISVHVAALIGLYGVIWYYYRRINAIRSTEVQFWIMFVLYQFGQVSMLYRARFDKHESFTSSILCSTVMMIMGEINPVHSLLLNGVLVAKHIVLWTLVAWSKGVPGEAFSFTLSAWCMWMLLIAMERKRKLLTAKQQAEEAKQVEEQRLKALLSAIPDGVIVISDDFRILTYNPAALQQLHLQTAENPELSLNQLIQTLQYDYEYLSSEEEEHRFDQDLKQLILNEISSTKSFKPVLHQGIHLECRGCVAKWDEKKVLVLIARDNSNWAQLEKAAKQDSANKTALIRSVSHELRTPVNAILNICQDLQTSPALGDQEREDIEVLANASHFLLSMINDLLDYSRILHEKFTLAKTNFDLERLIRSCGRLIALQCKLKQVDFIVRYDPFLPKFAYSDENRLKQIILNLLSNAAK
jgi:signal transduction histidine kinase